MKFQRREREDTLEMNLVPLIDVLLVIIIFLVVSTTFSRTGELQINLPSVVDASAPQEKSITIEVSIDADEKYYINNKGLPNPSVAGISKALQVAVNGAKEPTIIISADAKSTHQSVVNVMEAARSAGYTHITFATQAKAGA